MSNLVLYLGKQGGGARLFRDLIVSSENNLKSNQTYFYCKKNFEFADEMQNKPLLATTNFSNNKFFIFTNFFLKWKEISRIVKHCMDLEVTTVVDVMPHFWSLSLARTLKKRNIRYTPIIHDHKAHLGEVWPTSRFNNKLARISFGVIFLNPISASRFAIDNKIVSKLEVTSLVNHVEGNISSDYFIFAGRLKKYKNLEALFTFADSLPDGMKLKVVGTGQLRRKYNKKLQSHSKIEFRNEWLAYEIFEYLIIESRGLFLPYIEATQSGPAAIAMCYGVPIIYNPIEALEFQLRDYNKKSTIKEFELNYDKILGNTLRKSSKFSISLFDQISILK